MAVAAPMPRLPPVTIMILFISFRSFGHLTFTQGVAPVLRTRSVRLTRSRAVGQVQGLRQQCVFGIEIRTQVSGTPAFIEIRQTCLQYGGKVLLMCGAKGLRNSDAEGVAGWFDAETGKLALHLVDRVGQHFG